MKINFIKSVGFQLFILAIIVLSSLITTSYMFNNKIDKLKHQIDNIYFGNFIPIVKLESILDNYRSIIKCRTLRYKCDFKQEQETIINEWNYYYGSYKSDKEKKVLDDINTRIHNTFKENKLHIFKRIQKKIDFLITYETKIAYQERKIFTDEYKQMKEFLSYSIWFIGALSFILIIAIIFRLIRKDNQLRILSKHYQKEAITDGLTNLYNRKYFDRIFDNMPFISNEKDWKSAFIILDIDYFKQYNDTYGHDAGDEALRKVSAFLKDYFNQKYDYVFRIGGEEFGIILFDLKEEELESYLVDINKKIVELNIEHKNSQVLDVLSVSIGAVINQPHSYVSTNSLYKRADECLYNSKSSGRNQYSIFKGE